MNNLVGVIPYVVAIALFSAQTVEVASAQPTANSPSSASPNPQITPAKNSQASVNPIKDAPGFPGKGNKESWQKATKHYNKGIDYAREKDYANAIKEYNQAIALYPFDPFFFSNLGYALWRRSELKDAETALRKAVALDKTFGGAWENLGNVLYDQGRLVDSRDAFNNALNCELALTKRNELMHVMTLLTEQIKRSQK